MRHFQYRESEKLQQLVRVARDGDCGKLIDQLTAATTAQHATCVLGQQLTVTERLLDEALWYARHGDLSEATYRLEQAAS